MHDLVERANARENLGRVVDALAGGAGSVLVVRGPVGHGKSTLLARAASMAADAGITVRRFRSTPAERTHAWGGVRELLGRAAEGPADAATLAALHDELALAAPVLLVVDDVQWLDPPTLRWLHYVGRRVDQRPVALVLSCRPGPPAPDLAELLALGQTIDLAPFTRQGTADLITRRLGPPDPAFLDRCMQLTGGNPFLVDSLLGAVAERALRPEAGALDELRDAPPTRVIDTVRMRLARLTDDHAAIAGAAAVAGRHATVGRLCELTGRSATAVTEAVGELRDTGLVGSGDTATFVHPLEATAAVRELSPTLVEQLHRRMAELLHDEGGDDDEIAAHLEHAGPVGEPWAPEVLLRAGRRTGHAGDHQTAVRWLRRALAEPVHRGSRAEVLGALARSELAIGLPAGLGRLRAVYEETGDPVDRFRLARHLAVHGRLHEAAAELDALADTVEGPLLEQVRRQQLSTLRQSLDLRPRSRALVEQLTAEPDQNQDPALLAELAYEHALVGTSRDLVADLGARAVEAAEHDTLPTAPVQVLFLALVWAGELRLADHLVRLRDRRGEIPSLQHHRRGQLAMTVGAIDRARSHSVAAVEGMRFDAPVIFPGAVAQLARCHVRLDELDEADRLLQPLMRDLALRHLVTFHPVLLARAELALARQEWDDALAAAEACRQFSERMGTENPVVMPWHPVAAEALVALDRVSEARDVATEALARIDRFGDAPEELRRPLERIVETAGAEQRRSAASHPTRRPVAAARPAGPVLRVLGTSRLEAGGDTTVLGTDLTDRALRFLGVQRGPVHRDQLVEALWPEVDPGIGRARLRKVLSQLRHRHGDVLETAGDLVGLSSEVTVDVREFRRLAFEAVNATDDATVLSVGPAALHWYGGELCELDRYEDWVADVREAVRQDWAALSRRVADRWAAAGQHDRALQRARTAAPGRALARGQPHPGGTLVGGRGPATCCACTDRPGPGRCRRAGRPRLTRARRPRDGAVGVDRQLPIEAPAAPMVSRTMPRTPPAAPKAMAMTTTRSNRFRTRSPVEC